MEQTEYSSNLTELAVRPSHIAPSPLIQMWLHGLSAHTQRAYQHDLHEFFASVGISTDDVNLDHVRAISIEQVQTFDKAMIARELSDNTRLRRLAALKSFFGYIDGIKRLDVNPLAAIRLPTVAAAITERILPEADTAALIEGAASPRDRTLLKVIYVGGFRVSELVGANWRDARAQKDSGQLTVLGKGKKMRSVSLPKDVWADLMALRLPKAIADSPIFVSRRGSRLSASQMRRLIKTAAKAAGIDMRVSPHWLRHCHASHALDNGAPLHLVQRDLGHANVSTTSRYLHARQDQSSSSFLPKIPTGLKPSNPKRSES